MNPEDKVTVIPYALVQHVRRGPRGHEPGHGYQGEADDHPVYPFPWIIH